MFGELASDLPPARCAQSSPHGSLKVGNGPA